MKKVTYRNWIYLAIIFSAFILIALLNSCKSRKKADKDYPKTANHLELTAKYIKGSMPTDTAEWKEQNFVK